MAETPKVCPQIGVDGTRRKADLRAQADALQKAGGNRGSGGGKERDGSVAYARAGGCEGGGDGAGVPCVVGFSGDADGRGLGGGGLEVEGKIPLRGDGVRSRGEGSANIEGKSRGLGWSRRARVQRSEVYRAGRLGEFVRGIHVDGAEIGDIEIAMGIDARADPGNDGGSIAEYQWRHGVGGTSWNGLEDSGVFIRDDDSTRRIHGDALRRYVVLGGGAIQDDALGVGAAAGGFLQDTPVAGVGDIDIPGAVHGDAARTGTVVGDIQPCGDGAPGVTAP